MEVEITSATISQILKRHKVPKLGARGKSKQGQTVYLAIDECGKGQNLRSKKGRKGEYKQKCII